MPMITWGAEGLDYDDLNSNFDLVSSYKIASGTTTLQAATTTYDTDYVDISIASGDLEANDFICIEITAENSNQAASMRVDINDVTTTGTIDTVTLAQASFPGTATVKICQVPGDTDNLRLSWYSISQSFNSALDNHVTGDANVLTTAFTLRLNFVHGSSASSDRNIRYLVRGLRG